ncbi:DUF2283 domain-containing protein [Candidatus Woesearchaeota archaeon]|nr:DUF2283 domain-containing protein [Candidatus Woesearchaeota archaeon]
MQKPRHLDGTGKGEFSYDYKYDTLMVKIKDRNYKQSFEFQNFVTDIDDEGFITGIRIFDASKVLKVDKYVLKNIVEWEFNTRVEDNIITITFRFVGKVRNREVPLTDFSRQLSTPAPTPIADSYVECAVSA